MNESEVDTYMGWEVICSLCVLAPGGATNADMSGQLIGTVKTNGLIHTYPLVHIWKVPKDVPEPVRDRWHKLRTLDFMLKDNTWQIIQHVPIDNPDQEKVVDLDVSRITPIRPLAVLQKIDLRHYPRKCNACGEPAYISALTVDCSNASCRWHRKA